MIFLFFIPNFNCNPLGTPFQNGKTANRSEIKKIPLTDIDKNATSAVGPQSAAKKKAEAKVPNEDYIEFEEASSTDVDIEEVWANKAALSDAEITRWIELLNAYRAMNPYDETEPPKPIPEEDLGIELENELKKRKFFHRKFIRFMFEILFCSIFFTIPFFFSS